MSNQFACEAISLPRLLVACQLPSLAGPSAYASAGFTAFLTAFTASEATYLRSVLCFDLAKTVASAAPLVWAPAASCADAQRLCYSGSGSLRSCDRRGSATTSAASWRQCAWCSRRRRPGNGSWTRGPSRCCPSAAAWPTLYGPQLPRRCPQIRAAHACPWAIVFAALTAFRERGILCRWLSKATGAANAVLSSKTSGSQLGRLQLRRHQSWRGVGLSSLRRRSTWLSARGSLRARRWSRCWSLFALRSDPRLDPRWDPCWAPRFQAPAGRRSGNRQL